VSEFGVCVYLCTVGGFGVRKSSVVGLGSRQKVIQQIAAWGVFANRRPTLLHYRVLAASFYKAARHLRTGFSGRWGLKEGTYCPLILSH